MTQTAKKLVDEFDQLTEQERVDILAELPQRAALAPHDLPEDDDMVAAADRLFVDLDRREQQP